MSKESFFFFVEFRVSKKEEVGFKNEAKKKRGKKRDAFSTLKLIKKVTPKT